MTVRTSRALEVIGGILLAASLLVALSTTRAADGEEREGGAPPSPSTQLATRATTPIEDVLIITR